VNLWQILVAVGALHQAAVHCEIEAEKRRIYQEAREYADLVGKPLLVVGGPFGFGRKWGPPSHGCGDVCLDINIEACRGCERAIEGNVTDMSMFSDKMFGASFCSHVLEHLPSEAEAEKALSELDRVSEAVFLVLPTKLSILAWFHHDHHFWLAEENGIIKIKQRG